MGSATSTPVTLLPRAVCEAADQPAALVPAGDLHRLGVAAADHEIGLACAQDRQHARQEVLVVLQVGVDHGQIGCGAGQHAFDAGRGQATAPEPAQAAHPPVLLRQLAHAGGGAVGRIVVDDDHFPGHAGETALQGPDQPGHIAAFVEGGDDYAELGNAELRDTVLGRPVAREDRRGRRLNPGCPQARGGSQLGSSAVSSRREQGSIGKVPARRLRSDPGHRQG